jgi:glutamyl-tRNA reductase
MLEHLSMIGISWRQNGSEALGHFSLRDDQRDARLLAFAESMHLAELAYVATCNRVELIFVRTASTPGEDIRPQAYAMLTGCPARPGQAERSLKAWSGEGAAEHLFLVTAALDSASIGEAEIGGQVRAAHELAQRLGTSGATLGLLFEEAYRVAARVRGDTGINRGRVSLAEIAVELIKQRHAEFGGQVALIGVSPMTERAAVSLHKAGIPLLMVNRSTDTGYAFAEKFNAEYCALEDFRDAPPALTALLSATGSPTPVVGTAVLKRLAAAANCAPLLIDMAVPPDIDPGACAALEMPRTGMDEIVAIAEKNRSARVLETAAAREIVDDALLLLNDRIVESTYGPLMGALQKRYQRTAAEGVKRLLKKDLQGLGEAERAALGTWAEILARRFAHIPARGVRGLISEGPAGSVDAFLGGLEPEFADELRASLHPRDAGLKP